MGRSRASWAIAAAVVAWGTAALSAPFDFVPAPQTDLNRVYRVDRTTGEVTACQYGLQEGGIGYTVCFPAGQNAGAQAAGEYGIVASRHEREGGVFRTNARTGEMSVCYVADERVVCTPPAGAAPARPGATRP